MPVAAAGALLLIVSYYSIDVLPRMVGRVYEHPYYAFWGEIEALGPRLGKGPLMSDDPWRVHHITRFPCYMLPSDGAETALALADRVGAHRLLVRGGQAGKLGLGPAELEALPPGLPRLQLIARLESETQLDYIDVYEVYRVSAEAEAAARRGAALRERGDLGAALAAFRRAAELQGAAGSGPYRLQAARCLLDMGRPGEAAPRLRECVRLDPDSAAGHYYLAQCLEALGERDEALRHFLATWVLEKDEAKWPLARGRLREVSPAELRRLQRQQTEGQAP
jgi:tetratricopeptide (TPR) repeat protein